MRSTEYYPVFRFRSVAQTRHILATGLLPMSDPKYFNDPFDASKRLYDEFFEYLQNLFTRNEYNYITDLFDTSIGTLQFGFYPKIISFNLNATHPLMWAHYAQDHRGIALEFEALNLKKTGYLRDIKYHIQYPRLIDKWEIVETILDLEILNNSMTHMQIDQDFKKQQIQSKMFFLFNSMIIELCSSKHESWAYEEEVRLIFSSKLLPQDNRKFEKMVEKSNNSESVKQEIKDYLNRREKWLVDKYMKGKIEIFEYDSSYKMNSFSEDKKYEYNALCLITHNAHDRKKYQDLPIVDDPKKIVTINGIYFGMKTPLAEILEIVQYVEENLNKDKPEQEKIKYYQCVPHDVKMEIEAKPFRFGKNERSGLNKLKKAINKNLELKQIQERINKIKGLDLSEELLAPETEKEGRLKQELKDLIKAVDFDDYLKTNNPISELKFIRDRYNLEAM